MPLAEYKRKRNFRVTPEPAPKKAQAKGWSYVVQKHAASHLHYDFRLELDGVLLSWAVPKGPSLDPANKRLAIQVEDHPVDYGQFEGTIPPGEYGGGTVMLWDCGTWEPLEDPRKGLRQGRLKFRLHGKRLKGGWMLVRRGGAKTPDERHWFLIKERDRAARGPGDPEITAEHTRSVTSRRGMERITSDNDRVWSSKQSTASHNGRAKRKRGVSSSRRRAKSQTVEESGAGGAAPLSTSMLAGQPSATLPALFQPQLATHVKTPPDGEQWMHEIKFDGYRMISRIDRGNVRLFSRNQQDWTHRLPHLAHALKSLNVTSALLDGEVVALAPDGTSNFQALQNAFRLGRSSNLVYFLFDALYLEGRDLRGLALEDRKQILAELLTGGGQNGPLRYTEHVVGHGPEFFREACRLGLEGIISKRRDRPSQSGRGYDWLKTKCLARDEFVIGGYTDPAGARLHFGALLVGYFDDSGQLTYAGKVGTGYSQQMLGDLLKRMRPLEQEESPFHNLRKRTGPAKTVHWLKPELVAQVEFGSWTDDGKLRHPSFLGLREDKPAREVRRDQPLPVAEAEKKTMPAKHHRNGRSHAARTSGETQTEFAGVRLTHPDKVLYPDHGITKRQLAAYYEQVAEWMLPHLENRPLVLVRCPDGMHKECFYQKHAGVGIPKALRLVPIREKTKTLHYATASNLAALVSLAQIGVLEIHVWGSQIDNIERPDRLVFDLDPDPALPWKLVVQSAHQIREFLEDLGLKSWVKTTGGKGLHIVVPVQRRHDWNETKRFCQLVAEAIVSADPDRYTSNMAKRARGGKIFIDYLRNARGATAVAAYSTRARPGAPISTPLAWSELTPKTTAAAFDIHTVPKRLAALKQDPWHDLAATRQAVTKEMLKRVTRAESVA